MTEVLGFPIDGNWVDFGSVITAATFAVGRRTVCWFRDIPLKNIAVEAASGASVFPLLLMMAAPLSSHALKGLLEASKITLATAGMLALWAIITDGMAKKSDEKTVI